MNQAREPLFFGLGGDNAKLGDNSIRTFCLPAGWACPFARTCLAKADRENGRITDGERMHVRCYSASSEARYPYLRRNAWRNYELLKDLSSTEQAKLILDSLSPFAKTVRVHVGGDFFSMPYFLAWLKVWQDRPDTLFYFYTKALPMWSSAIDWIGDGYGPGKLPNVVPTASWGGTRDDLIVSRRLRSVVIVENEEEAEEMGLECDHDDTHAMNFWNDFALVVHGIQPSKRKRLSNAEN